MNINEILADVEEISIRVAVLEKKTKNLSAEVENLKRKRKTAEQASRPQKRKRRVYDNIYMGRNQGLVQDGQAT